MKKYKCLFNHELLIAFTTQTPYQSYRDEVGREQFIGYIRELGGTQVDAVMFCPTAWRLPLYRSKVNPIWQAWAPRHEDPNPAADWKYFDKVFHRAKAYMLRDDYEDPVQLSLDEARAQGIGFFFSYRMNDHHTTYYGGDRISPTMDPLWRDHPEMRLHTGNGHYGLNYLCPEVRDYYYALIEELVETYDVDGFEFDFMRSPCYFPEESVAEGIGLMNAFVRKVRALLQKVGERRGKRLALSARVPNTLKNCLAAGLDVPTWKREGWVDMINVSSYFTSSPEVGIEEMKELPGGADVYGEMHFVTYRSGGELTCNVNRRTSREIYETLAASFLGRGADGVSLFNFSYCRDHHFSEARRRVYMNPEPPFDVLRHIVDAGYLRGRPIHYVITPGLGTLPEKIPALRPLTFRMFLPSAPDSPCYGEAALRLEISKPGYLYTGLKVRIGGAELRQVPGSGELFPPFSNEALPLPSCLFFFEVPLGLLRQGWNEITVEASLRDEHFTLSLSDYQLKGVELAVYGAGPAKAA